MNAEKGGAAVLWGVQKVKRKKEDGGRMGLWNWVGLSVNRFN